MRMAEPFLSEIRIMSFNFAPKGWALCNGRREGIARSSL
jgi:microcystin-dependent protein